MNRFLTLFAAPLLVGAALHAGTVSFVVSVNSAPALGQAGFIDLQFNQDTNGTPLAAIATITNFSSSPDYSFNDANNFATTGVSGAFDALPLAIPNNGPVAANEFAQGVDVFGSGFSFLLTLSGEAIGGASDAGSEFFVTLQDTNTNPIFGDSDLGSVASLVLNADGSQTAQSGTFGSVSQTPEPSTLLLVLLAAPFLIRYRRGRRISA